MNSPNKFVRFFPALFAALAGTYFVAIYTSVKVNNAYYEGVELPVLAYVFSWISPYCFVLPALMLVAFIACVRSDKETALVVDIISSIGWLYAFIWSLSCIVVWELPYMLVGVSG